MKNWSEHSRKLTLRRINVNFIMKITMQSFSKSLFAALFLLAASPVWCARKPKAAERPLRIACVGNSVTYGYGLANRERDAYPVRLQQMLDSTYGARRFEVANFGHSGATLLYKGHRPYINLPEFHQALDFKPDWVVIHLGLNDTDPRNWPDWKEGCCMVWQQ